MNRAPMFLKNSLALDMLYLIHCDTCELIVEQLEFDSDCRLVTQWMKWSCIEEDDRILELKEGMNQRMQSIFNKWSKERV